ncbi:hypothetical protein RRG08_048436 [Elysia crispata]|uniref:Uncharacterized protein n=1 Tax=Elysia crispata TaxID=231223 RepID=A0AAE1B8Q1_9GAST|nr:hypothetical protein RRG08_048436 [Elysia crispata]
MVTCLPTILIAVLKGNVRYRDVMLLGQSARPSLSQGLQCGLGIAPIAASALNMARAARRRPCSAQLR